MCEENPIAEEGLVIRYEVPADERLDGRDVYKEVVIYKSLKMRELSLKIPEGLELSEEEMRAILDVTKNDIVDIVRSRQAEMLALSEKTKRKAKCKKQYIW
jgi:hypothetical protein